MEHHYLWRNGHFYFNIKLFFQVCIFISLKSNTTVCPKDLKNGKPNCTSQLGLFEGVTSTSSFGTIFCLPTIKEGDSKTIFTESFISFSVKSV